MNTVLIYALLGLPLAMSPQTDKPMPEVIQEVTKQTPEVRFKALELEAEKITDAWYADITAQMEEAEANGKEMPMISMSPPLGPIVTKFQAAASDYAGTDDAVMFLSWIAQSGMQFDQKAGKAAFVTLFDNHIKSEGLNDLVETFPSLTVVLGEKRGLHYLAKIESESPHPKIRDWATFARLSPILNGSSLDSKEYSAAKTEFNKVLESTKDRRLKSSMSYVIRLLEQFGLGMVAPDISGIDLDGVAFSLSDYKGKILFVDFWGDW